MLIDSGGKATPASRKKAPKAGIPATSPPPLAVPEPRGGMRGASGRLSRPGPESLPSHLQTMNTSPGFKGNKQSLPSKPCAACGRPMSWRKKWEKNWEQVKYCSEACRLARPARPAA